MLMGRSGLGDSGEDPGSGYYRELPLKLLLLCTSTQYFVVVVVVLLLLLLLLLQQQLLGSPPLNYSLTVIERVLTSTREQISET